MRHSVFPCYSGTALMIKLKTMRENHTGTKGNSSMFNVRTVPAPSAEHMRTGKEKSLLEFISPAYLSF